MKIGTTVLVLGLAVIGLAGCETVDDGYYDGPRQYRTYDGPREYRSAPYYRYSERRIPPPYYRDDPRDRYDGDRYDRDRYDGGGRGRLDRDRDDDRGRDRDRPGRPDRNDNPRPPRQAESTPRPPREYTPPVRPPNSGDQGARQDNRSNPDLTRCVPDPSRGSRGRCPTE